MPESFGLIICSYKIGYLQESPADSSRDRDRVGAAQIVFELPIHRTQLVGAGEQVQVAPLLEGRVGVGVAERHVAGAALAHILHQVVGRRDAVLLLELVGGVLTSEDEARSCEH